MARIAQRGALLLEALVAIAVFSIGILGNVAMQAQALRHVDAAHYRGEAMHVAQGLIGWMSAADPATLVARYSGPGTGPGYDAFARMALRLPGSALPGNAPEVRVEAGPSAASRRVSIALHWQMPGERSAHHYTTSAVIGGN